ncbi:Cytochrome P450 monooxygenase alt2 [Apiospora saccharicola]|uniref:Cytochrome P450 monooxygenase alt2 n=1 Tax=Apiospora saccharicola TaxID=335842 RepID=A0ABR1ULS6_9PEZI
MAHEIPDHANGAVLYLTSSFSRIQLLVGLGVFLVLLRLINIYVAVPWRYWLKARQLGCGAVPTEPRKWPFGLDIVRNALMADKDQRMPEFVTGRFAAMGRYTWRMNVLGSSNFITAEPRNIQAILATQFDDFKLGDVRTTNLKMFLGRSIFAVDGPAWHSAREVMRPLFTRENVSNVRLLEGRFQSMMRCLLESSEGVGSTSQDKHGRTWTAPVSLVTLLPRFTLDSATEVFLGQSAHSLEARLRGEKKEDLNWALEQMVPLLRLRRVADVMHRFTNDAMDKADATVRSGENKDKYDFLDTLRARCADRDEVREQVLGLLAAGTDTTAALTGWVFYSLIRNPRVFAKLRQIVFQHFGAATTTSGRNAGDNVTFEKLKNCTYLQHVLNETLRRHSVVPLNSRCATRDTTLPTGGGPDGTQPIFVPAGTEVNFSTHVLHRRKDLWGPDADDFVPERWEKRRPGVFHYVPFNGGPRICIGQQFALTEAGFVVVRMLQEFDAIEGLDLHNTPRDYSNFGITCAPGSSIDRHEGVLCRLRLAK